MPAPRADATTTEEDVTELSEAVVRARVRSGAVLLALRGGVLKVIGTVGTLVVASILAPRDFGIVAIGSGLAFLASFTGDAGLGSAFIRQRRAPETSELAALVGFQAAIAAAFAAAVTAVALVAGGRGAWIAAAMTWSAPLLALKAPGVVDFERELNYRPQVLVEIAGVVVYNACAISLVAGGAGPWGVVIATHAMAVATVIAMARVSPRGLIRPSRDFTRLRPTFRFGLTYQASSAISVSRDQAMTFGVAAIASVATAGLWAIAFRVLAIPYMVFQSLWRLSSPAMARFIETGASPAPVIERTVALLGSITGLLLTGIAGTVGVAIPALLGQEWADAADAVPWACLGLMVTPISAAAAGFLLATNDAGTVLKTTIYQAITMIAVGLGLLPWLGVTAIGLGWLLSHVVDGIVIARGVTKVLDVHLFRPLVAPILAGIGAAVPMWIYGTSVPADGLHLVIVGLGSVGLYVALHMVLGLNQARDALRFVWRRKVG